MISQANVQPPQPPRTAAWLLNLFTIADQAESIMGDLAEEFSALVNDSNLASARSWYWRQALKTILHEAGAAFRRAPGLMLVTIAGGFYLVGFATRSSVHAMQTFLDTHRVYESNPNAYLFWLKFPLEAGRVLICFAIGAFVALMAKRVEMMAVLALVVLQTALFLAAIVAAVAGGREWLLWFLFMLLWNGLCWIATLLGGALVRIRRNLARPGVSAA